MTTTKQLCLCIKPARTSLRDGVRYCTRCTHKIVSRKDKSVLSEPEETIFKVECARVALTDQITLRVGRHSISVPAYRRDDNDFEKMTILKAIDFDLTRGEISLRYRPLEEKL